MLFQKRVGFVFLVLSMMGILTISSFATVNIFVYPHTSLTSAQKAAVPGAVKVWDDAGDLCYTELGFKYMSKTRTVFGSDNYDTVVAAMDFTNNNANAMIPVAYRSSSILALCLGPDVFMNTNVDSKYTTGTEIGKISFKGVLVHELGHIAGLEHSSVIGDTMYSEIFTIGSPYPSTDLVSLTTNDVNRLITLYSTPVSNAGAYQLFTQVEGPARTSSR
jgi:hypothetical protein